MPCLVLFLYVRYRTYKYRGRGLVVEYDIDERSVKSDFFYFFGVHRGFRIDSDRGHRSRLCAALVNFDMRFMQNFAYIKVASVAAFSEL